MKVTTEETNRDKEIKYPCIMVHEAEKDIVLYVLGEKNGVYKGIALGRPCISYWGTKEIGWIKEGFIPMKGKVILEND